MLAERSDPSLSLENLDFVVCTLARLCPLIARVWTDIPMIIYSSMPIMFSSPSPAHDQILLRQLRDLALDDNNLAAVTSPMWAAQFLYQVEETFHKENGSSKL